MVEKHRSAEGGDQDHLILLRMLEDARQLCFSPDALLVGQYQHLHGRIAALVEQTLPIATASERRPS